MTVTREKISLKNVADRAGVSLTTASYVLNNRPSIGEETRHRVRKAQRELGYRPLRARRARGL